MAKAKKDEVKEEVVETLVEATEPEEKVSEEPKEKKKPTAKASKPTDTETKLAKAGKRSAKAVAEVEEKQAKEERKLAASEEGSKEQEARKAPVKPARSKLERRGKKFQEAAKQVESGKAYTLAQGLELATKTSPVKFDATVELHIRLNVDPRQADQNLRDTIVLPAGTGKTVRVAVFADVDDAAKAKAAGADIAGGDEFLQQLDKGQIDFDVLIAAPTQMPKLGKYARVLGPKGLMPNPKSGTVAADVAKAVKEAKAGRVEYRVDSTGIVHVGIGKVSFGSGKLLDNAKAVMSSIRGNKPSSIKGALIRSAFVTTSMGPSIQLEITDL